MAGADYARIKDPARREHYVYRLLTKRGKTLYIGCSMNLKLRLSEHRRHGGYGHAIHRVKCYGPYSYDAARALERRLIEAEEPPFNTEWTRRHVRGVAGYAIARRLLA